MISPTASAKRIVTGKRSLCKHELKLIFVRPMTSRRMVSNEHFPRCRRTSTGFGVSGPIYVSRRHVARRPQEGLIIAGKQSRAANHGILARTEQLQIVLAIGNLPPADNVEKKDPICHAWHTPRAR